MAPSELYVNQGSRVGRIRFLKLVHVMLSRWQFTDFLRRVSSNRIGVRIGFEALFKEFGDAAGLYLDGDHVVFEIGGLEGELAPVFNCEGLAALWIPHYPVDPVIGLNEAYLKKWLKFLFSAADEVRFVDTGSAALEWLDPIDEEFDIELSSNAAEQASVELSDSP